MKNNRIVSQKSINELTYLKPRYVPDKLISAIVFIALLIAIYCGFISHQLPDFSAYTTTLLLLISLVICPTVMPRNFSVGFLTSLLPFAIAWRVGAMNDVKPIMVICSIGMFFFAIQFFDCMRNDQNHYKKDGWLGDMQWQMTFVRIYFAYNEVGHCTEKLFAGNDSFQHLEQVFYRYGLHTNTGSYVIFAGLCELALAIGLGFGFLTRLAGLGWFLYILSGNQYGGHFFNGYTWNIRASGGLSNGGWEYILLLLVFFGSFVISGAGKFSVDRWLIDRHLMPSFLIPCCLSKAGREALERNN